MVDDEKTQRARRLIQAENWRAERWAWMECVRRDHDLSMTARAVADYMATEKANRVTLRCDPSYRQISEVFGISIDTAKRAVRDLLRREWLMILDAGQPGRSARYGFLTDAKIVRLKPGQNDPSYGGKNAPIDGGKNAPKQNSSMGANLHTYGGKNAPPYIKDKPRKNQEEREAGSDVQKKRSETAQLSSAAQFWIKRIETGQSITLSAISSSVENEIRASGRLTAEQLNAAGFKG